MFALWVLIVGVDFAGLICLNCLLVCFMVFSCLLVCLLLVVCVATVVLLFYFCDCWMH